MNAASLLSLLARIAAPLALLALLFVVNQQAEQRGYDKAILEFQASELAGLTVAIESSRALAGQMGQIVESSQKEKADAKKSIEALASDLRSGALRLSIKTIAQPAVDHHGAIAGTEPARADIDPATAESLVRITADGDDAIRDLNTCIVKYDAVKRAVEVGHAQTH